MPLERSHALAALFPDGVVVHTLGEDGPAPELMGAETDAVARAVPKRRAEFARGRACARAGCRALGLEAVAIPVGPDRAPIWPEGAVGSITHCEGLVAAAVGRCGSVQSLGLDAEPRAGLEADLVARIAAPEELAAARAVGSLPTDLVPRLLFSAKEVVHKCVHPLLGETLDFLDVVIALAPDGGHFGVEPGSERARAIKELRTIVGRLAIGPDHIVAAGAIVATGTPAAPNATVGSDTPVAPDARGNGRGRGESR